MFFWRSYLFRLWLDETAGKKTSLKIPKRQSEVVNRRMSSQ